MRENPLSLSHSHSNRKSETRTNRWSEMQQHASQNPNPLPLYTPSNHLYTTHYPSHYQPPNPNPNPSIDPRQPHYTAGPAVYPYASVSSLPQIHGGGGVGFEAYQTHVAYPHHQTSAVPSGYYQDPNWSANGVIPHYGSTRYATVSDWFVVIFTSLFWLFRLPFWF